MALQEILFLCAACTLGSSCVNVNMGGTLANSASVVRFIVYAGIKIALSDINRDPYIVDEFGKDIISVLPRIARVWKFT